MREGRKAIFPGRRRKERIDLKVRLERTKRFSLYVGILLIVIMMICNAIIILELLLTI